MTKTEQQVETSDRELVLTRTFEAPPELVFEAYSSCEHLRNWWGPRSWPMAECTLDFRVGGVWHYCLRGPNEGDESWGHAVYDEIERPRRIVYTDAFADAEGNVNEAMPSTRVHIEFTAAGEGETRLTMRAVYPTQAELQQVIDMGMIPGITETLDRLDEHLAKALR